MKQLDISPQLKMPVSAATQKLAWLGTTGSGKTYGSSKFAEELFDAGAQFAVLDPVGVWYGLRLAKDGKKPSDIDIPIFGGLHGDLPLDPAAGKLVANLLVDKGISAIIDVSQFESDAAKARFAGDFADQFFFRKKSLPGAVQLLLEEAQEFIPQNPQRGEERMLHAFVRLQKLGRNFGIGTSIITQRPQEVNKKALNMAQTLFVFRNTGTHERKAIEAWIKDNSLDENIANDLPKIPTGQCHVWSPEFLKVSKMVAISEKRTFNASATPEVGKKSKKAASLSAIDVGALKTQMQEVVKQAELEDPKLLRKTIEELNRKLREKNAVVKPSAPVTDPKAIEKAVTRAVSLRDQEWQKVVRSWMGWGDKVVALIKAMHAVADIAKLPQRPAGAAVMPVMPEVRETIISPKIAKVEQVRPQVSTDGQSAEGITNQEQRVLDAIAWMESIGVKQPSRPAVAFLSGYSHARSKGFTNPCGSLRSKGLIEYPNGDVIVLTEAGRGLAEYPTTEPTGDALRQAVLAKLPAPEQRVLKPLLQSYPGAMTNEQLAAASGYMHERSKGYTNPRGRLRSFGLVEYTGEGVKAAAILFP